jgi:hypothetical protein
MSAACLQHPKRFFPLDVSVPLSLEAPCWLRPSWRPCLPALFCDFVLYLAMLATAAEP